MLKPTGSTDNKVFKHTKKRKNLNYKKFHKMGRTILMDSVHLIIIIVATAVVVVVIVVVFLAVLLIVAIISTAGFGLFVI